MPSKSLICHNCHLSYWLPHVITNMPTFQIHFMSTPHACGLLGVLNLLYSQCGGMAAQKMNCTYRHWWNGALHCELLLLVTIKVIRHCEWYLCWQMPKIHAPFGPNGEQQIKHSSPFCMKGWSWATRIPFFFYTAMTYSQLSSRCVTNLCLHFPTSLVKC